MASKVIKASILIGGGVSSALKGALSSTQAGLKKIGQEIEKVDKKQRIMAQHLETFRRMGRSVDDLAARYGALTRRAEALRAAQTRLAAASARVRANAEQRGIIGGQLAGASMQFGAVAASTLFPIRAAAQFETAMLGVAKQVDGARDSAGNLTAVYYDMERQVKLLGRELPIATGEIARMVASGARMGVARDELIGYTKTVAMMSDALELPADEVADNMGKIAGLFALPIPRVGELADVINYLDDNAISKGGEIIEVMRRIGGMAQTLKMPAREAAALGSTFLTLGSSAEVSATSANAMMRILGSATAQSKRVRAGLESIGFDPSRIQASMTRDATGTILALLDRLNSLSDEQRMVATTRIFGAEYGDDIAKLAVGTREYRKQLALVRSEQAKGSVSREFGARMKSTEAQWQTAKNRLNEIAINVGAALLPAVNSLLASAAPLVEKFADWSKENPGLVKGIAGAALAVTGLRVGVLGLRYAWMTLRAPFLKASELMARFQASRAVGGLSRAGATFWRVAGAVRTLGSALAAVGAGPVAVVVGALVAGALLIRKYWQPIRAFVGGVFDGIRDSVAPAFNSLREAAAPLSPIFQAIGDYVSRAWQWFTQLIAPVQSTKGELKAAADAGATFGKIIGGAMSLAISKVTGVIRVVASLVSWLGEAWKKIGALGQNSVIAAVGAVTGVRLGSSAPTASPGKPAAVSRKAAPPIPKRAGGQPASIVQQNTYHITQREGESAEALAKRVAEINAQQQRVASRGRLSDEGG